jgi:hypothetical protein
MLRKWWVKKKYLDGISYTNLRVKIPNENVIVYTIK